MSIFFNKFDFKMISVLWRFVWPAVGGPKILVYIYIYTILIVWGRSPACIILFCIFYLRIGIYVCLFVLCLRRQQSLAQSISAQRWCSAIVVRHSCIGLRQPRRTHPGTHQLAAREARDGYGGRKLRPIPSRII